MHFIMSKNCGLGTLAAKVLISFSKGSSELLDEEKSELTAQEFDTSFQLAWGTRAAHGRSCLQREQLG